MKLRGNFELTLIFWKKRRTFYYEQALAIEYLRFLEEANEKDFNFALWVYDFFNKKCTSNKPFWQRKNISKREFLELLPKFDDVAKTIVSTYFRSFNKENKKEDEETMPFDAYILLLSKATNTNPLELLERYTFEQIGELSEAYIYLENEKTKEGQVKNKAKKHMEKMKKVDKEELAKQFDFLKNYHK